jgi:hypothetical protein
MNGKILTLKNGLAMCQIELGDGVRRNCLFEDDDSCKDDLIVGAGDK